MQSSVEKSKQSQHAAHANHNVPTRQTAHGSHRQCDQQESQCPVAGKQPDRLHRIGAQILVYTVPNEPGQWQQTNNEENRFDDPTQPLHRRDRACRMDRQRLRIDYHLVACLPQ